MTPDFDISLLRALATVAETGSVSAAAQRLSRTQGAVSMQLRRLEEDVGRRLLDRSSRGVTLTEAGHMLLGYARQALGAGEAVRRALSGTEMAGRVRLGILEDFAATRLSTALASFSLAHPGIRLELIVGCGCLVDHRLERGELDIALSSVEDFVGPPIRTWRHQLCWAISPGFDLAAYDELPLVLFDLQQTCAWRDQALARLDNADRRWRAVLSSSGLTAIQSAVTAGLGVGVMLDVVVARANLKAVPPEDGLPALPSVEIGLYVSPAASRDPAIGAVAEFFSTAI
jgi:DNA-binding transcriptional LysR family regulator